MQAQTLRKGTIQKIDDQGIVLFNLDGHCEDSFIINAQFADEIRRNIKPSEKIFYVIEGNDLLGIGLEESAPEELKMLYEAMPKDKDCKFWATRPPAKDA